MVNLKPTGTVRETRKRNICTFIAMLFCTLVIVKPIILYAGKDRLARVIDNLLNNSVHKRRNYSNASKGTTTWSDR
ncbi:MAG: hypothetical protein WA364_30615 [Candidatus Nitrosopolaris sp.]